MNFEGRNISFREGNYTVSTPGYYVTSKSLNNWKSQNQSRFLLGPLWEENRSRGASSLPINMFNRCSRFWSHPSKINLASNKKSILSVTELRVIHVFSETNSKTPLKIDGWKMFLSFWGVKKFIFRCVSCKFQGMQLLDTCFVLVESNWMRKPFWRKVLV